MKLIAAVDKNWGIGRNNRLLVNIPEDMQLFRQETNGKVVIMGRKTFESLKEKSPLYGRKNIVLTTNKSYDAKGAVVCSSVEEVLDAVKDYDDNDIYVIGGGEIYKEFLPYCDVAHITKIDYKYDADTYLENLDKNRDHLLCRYKSLSSGRRLYVLFLNECSNCFQNNLYIQPERECLCIGDIQLLAFFSRKFTGFASFLYLP